MQDKKKKNMKSNSQTKPMLKDKTKNIFNLNKQLKKNSS